MSHLTRMCWVPGGGEYCALADNKNEVSFPGINGSGVRNPPCLGEPRKRTLADGTDVKWCGLCGSWGDHYRVGHTTNATDEAIDEHTTNVAIESAEEFGGDRAQPTDGVYQRIF